MKRLALFLDGTWNEPDSHTNVIELYNRVLEGNIGGAEQRRYYHMGVGTQWYNKVIGGAVGAGLSENVQRAYAWLVDNYVDGDEIYLFGFSRGAYTARSVAGVIINCGLLKDKNVLRVEDLYARYQRGKDATPLYRLELQQQAANPPPLSDADRALMQHSRRVAIKFVGVWDTVGALGVPWTEAPLIGRGNFYFHNTNLSVLIENAYHALAIDENRAPYKPTLWTQFVPDVPDAHPYVPVRTPVVEQRWFIGAHSNVGGGYSGDDLRTISMAWLQGKARDCGLTFSNMITLTGAEYRTRPVDSFAKFMGGIYRCLRLGSRYYRPIGADPRKVNRGTSTPINEWIDVSVFQRYRDCPDYRPKNVSDWAARKGVSLEATPVTRQAG